MNTPRFNRSHVVLIVAMVLLASLAGFVSKVCTKAMERAISASASDLMELRATEYRWEFLRDGMVLGRVLNMDEAVYLFNLRLFGGDHPYALILDDDGRPKAFKDLGASPVSPHSARIAMVMRAYFGKKLEDNTAIDAIIAHAILTSVQTMAMHEHSRKETHRGN